MSFITPKEYRLLSEQIGAAYVALRDTFANSVGPEAIGITSAIVEAPDDDSNIPNSYRDPARAPIGSIANDLGVPAFRFEAKFTATEAKSLSSSYFSSIVQSLNSHVFTRTGLGITSMSYYLEHYKLVSGSSDMSLFSSDGANINTSYYFSQDFAELCGLLNITVTPYVRA